MGEHSKGEKLLEEEESPLGLRKNTEQRACFLARITYLFMWPLFLLGFRRRLEITDLSEPLDAHMSKVAVARMERAWECEKKRARNQKCEASLFRAIRREYAWNVMKYGVLLFLEELIKLFQPVFMGRLIRYFEASTVPKEEAYYAAFGVSATVICYVILHHPYFYGVQKVGLELKVAASGLLMKKGVSLSSSALHQVSVGRLINLITTDVNKFDVGFMFFHYSWVAPLLLVGYTVMLWRELGASCMAGFLALVVMCPIQVFFSRKQGRIRREIASRTDKRISVMNEILNGIRVLKMYAWEGAFSDIMGQVRRREISSVRKNAIYQSMVMGLFWVSGKFMILFALLAFIYSGNAVTAERVFVATALYNACRLPITLFFPFSIQFLSEMRVSVKRIQEFLELEDYDSVASTDESPSTEESSTKYVKMENYTSLWCERDDEAEIADTKFACKNVSLTVEPGNLVAIIGAVGSGKSSLLSSILGEARRVSGSLKMNGKAAYVPQDPWIFSGTIRENILFGKAYDEKRYKETISVCELQQDFQQFDYGDSSLVGDRGTALSGGQKARICLARAVYRDADIYLLDDPLSAVDTCVGRKLFENCINKFLRRKIVLLVTHQIQYLDKADNILILEKGEVVADGVMSELRKTNSGVFQHLNHDEEDADKLLNKSFSSSTHSLRTRTRTISSHPVDEDADESHSLLNSSRVKSGSVILGPEAEEEGATQRAVDEDSNSGAVSWSIYWQYIKSMGTHPLLMVPLVVFFFFVQAFSNFIDWWLNKWTTAEGQAAKNGTALPMQIMEGLFEFDVSLLEFRYTFIVCCLLLTAMSIARCVWFRVAQTVAARILHDRMFKAVVNAKMFFFDSNPIGRILNRFSKDVGTLDDQLSFVFFDFLMGLINLIGMFLVIIAMNFYVVAAALPLIVLFFLLRMVYLSTSREIKRIESTSRSPLYSHISAVMHGLVTVRAFNNQEKVLEEYHHYQNLNVSAFYATLTASRWFAAGIDWLAALFVTCASFSLTFLSDDQMAAGEAGLILVYAVQMAGFFSWIMRQSAELQNGMVSVERIIEYSELESEPKGQQKPPSAWPSEGRIVMNNVSLKYEGTDEMVLKHINMQIQPREKIGIVGRTGAGKSSLLRALFRLTEPSGSIYIDGLDISHIDLECLRKKISIIPQDPVLFIGTLRRNLDPFDEFSDYALWDALEQVEMKASVMELSASLETHMQEGGVNFSVGQRQLICLARALLRSSRILVIDEATANVDLQTDALIQITIKRRFVNSTVLTIAHRLKTIMDSDRVMVLEHGELVECNHPFSLLQNPNSYFSGLVAETGNAAAQLKEIARCAYDARSQDRTEPMIPGNDEEIHVLEAPFPRSNGAKVFLGPGGEALKVTSLNGEHILSALNELELNSASFPEIVGIPEFDHSITMTFKLLIGPMAFGVINVRDHDGMIFPGEWCRQISHIFPSCRVSMFGHMFMGRWNLNEYYKTDSQDIDAIHILGLPPEVDSDMFRTSLREGLDSLKPYRFVLNRAKIIGVVKHPKEGLITPALIRAKLLDAINENNLCLKVTSIEGTHVDDLKIAVKGTQKDLKTLQALMSNAVIDEDTRNSYIEVSVQCHKVVNFPAKNYHFIKERLENNLRAAMTFGKFEDSQRFVITHHSWRFIQDINDILIPFVNYCLDFTPSDEAGLECGICSNLFGLQKLSCSHVICNECLRTQISIDINENRIPLLCGECNHALNLKQILMMFINDRPMLDKLIVRSFNNHLNSIPYGVDVVYCITPDCIGFFTNPEPRYQTCGECSTEQCVMCALPVHGDISCEVYQRRQKYHGELRFWFLEDSENRKYCPHCHNGIEKQGGCMHVLCPTCGTHFCWECGHMADSSLAIHTHMAEHLHRF